jgi:hypothetical protein
VLTSPANKSLPIDCIFPLASGGNYYYSYYSEVVPYDLRVVPELTGNRQRALVFMVAGWTRNFSGRVA